MSRWFYDIDGAVLDVNNIHSYMRIARLATLLQGMRTGEAVCCCPKLEGLAPGNLAGDQFAVNTVTERCSN